MSFRNSRQRQSAIKEYARIVKNYNSKISRLSKKGVNVLPSRLSMIDVKGRTLNEIREITFLKEGFLVRGAETEVDYNGIIMTRAERNEYEQNLKRYNAKIKARRIREKRNLINLRNPKNQIDLMQIENDLNDIFLPVTKKPSTSIEFHKMQLFFAKTLYNSTRTEQTMVENYLKTVAETLSDEHYEEIKRLIYRMGAKRFRQIVENSEKYLLFIYVSGDPDDSYLTKGQNIIVELSQESGIDTKYDVDFDTDTAESRYKDIHGW